MAVERRKYSEEFKREAIPLQESSGKTVAEVEREQRLSHRLLRQRDTLLVVHRSKGQG